MPYSSLLLLPMSGVFFFALHSVICKYRIQRLDAQKLLIIIISCTLLWIILLGAIRLVLFTFFPESLKTVTTVLTNLPIKHIPYLYTALFSFITPVILALGLNLFIESKFIELTHQDFIIKAIEEGEDSIDKIIVSSLLENEPTPLNISLKNNKVYIAYPTRISPPKKDNFIEILPITSGYRTSETKELKLTTYYHTENYKLSSSLFIRKDEILSIGYFSTTVYDYLEEQKGVELESVI